MSRSLARGEPVHLDGRSSTIADGLAAAPFMPASTRWRMFSTSSTRVVRVSDTEITDALRLLVQRCKLVPEPSGAASLAALISGRVAPVAGSVVVCITSGGNIGPDVLRQLL